MKVGLVGFAGSGKTTVFNALTGLRADTGFAGRAQANLGVIKVPDARVDFLTEVYKPPKKTYAEVSFVDVAGPEAKSDRSGLDKRIVTEMRQADALVHVVRAFANPAIERAPDPLRDLTDFEAEMILTDLIQVEEKLDRLRKEGKKTQERTLIEKLQAHLDAHQPLRTASLGEAELQAVRGFTFLSLKPCLALINRADSDAAKPLAKDLEAAAAASGVRLMSMAARAEAEIAELPPDDQKAFLADLGVGGSARDRFVAAAYALLDLISFLTAGEDECRAWTITRGTHARRAAGKIHSDIERGFIRAEVIAFADFKDHPSEARCREAGKLRVEGKDYLVQDGDIIHFRFAV